MMVSEQWNPGQEEFLGLEAQMDFFHQRVGGGGVSKPALGPWCKPLQASVGLSLPCLHTCDRRVHLGPVGRSLMGGPSCFAASLAFPSSVLVFWGTLGSAHLPRARPPAGGS